MDDYAKEFNIKWNLPEIVTAKPTDINFFKLNLHYEDHCGCCMYRLQWQVPKSNLLNQTLPHLAFGLWYTK